MLFDLEDYMYTGIVNRRDYVPEKSLANSVPYVEDLATTGYATGNDLRGRVTSYFRAAIEALPLQLKSEATAKFINFQRKFRAYKANMKPYFDMLRSTRIVHEPGYYQFQDGDRYNINNEPTTMNKNYCDYIVDEDAGSLGKIDAYTRYYEWNGGQDYKYNQGAKQKLEGLSSTRYAALNRTEGEYTYQSYNESVQIDYEVAVVELMQSVKELIIACEGYSNNLQ